MDLHQLRCFVAAAEELHFGRAAQRLEMLPSALGRFIRLLEEDLGTRLMTRTTRSIALTDDGAILVKEARALLAQADALAANSERAAGSRPQPSAWERSIVLRLDCCRCSFTISESNGRTSRFNWSKIRRYAYCHECCPAGLTSLSSARQKAPTSDWNLCFFFMRPPSSWFPIITRSHLRNA
jgi:hypothetical protein